MKKKLPELCKIQYGYAFDSAKYTDDMSYPPLVRIRDIKRGFSETFYCGEYSNEYVLHSGDLLIGMDGEFNIARWRDRDALLNQRVCKIVAKDGICEEYLRFALIKTLKAIEDRTSFVTVKHLSAKELNNIELDIPLLEEQNRIASCLSKTEKIIELRHQQLEKLDLLVKSRFVEMFGDPILNNKQWKIDSLVNVTNKIGSGATPKGGKESYQAEGISLIRSLNVHDGGFEYDDLAHITDAQAKELDNVKIEKNDVFINITGASVARSCIVPDNVLPARVNQHVSIVRCKPDVVNYIFINQMFLNPSYKKHLLAMGEAGGATRQAITKQQLEKLVIIVPPLELQNQFAAFVHQVDKSKFVIKQSIEKLELLKNKLMQDYFG